MLKTAALIFGAVFIVIGILGFIPAVAPPADDGVGSMVLGVFAVNPFHNWVHIISGVAAIVVGLMSEEASQWYFKIFGVVYALVAVAGIFVGRGYLMGMAHNVPDIVLHVVIAVAALYLGFMATPAAARVHR